MTSIASLTTSAYFQTRNTSDLLALKNQVETLSRQLTTGRAAETYAELGARRSESLSTRAILSAIDGYVFVVR